MGVAVAGFSVSEAAGTNAAEELDSARCLPGRGVGWMWWMWWMWWMDVDVGVGVDVGVYMDEDEDEVR